jgi:hypothetical protein
LKVFKEKRQYLGRESEMPETIIGRILSRRPLLSQFFQGQKQVERKAIHSFDSDVYARSVRKNMGPGFEMSSKIYYRAPEEAAPNVYKPYPVDSTTLALIEASKRQRAPIMFSGACGDNQQGR